MSTYGKIKFVKFIETKLDMEIAPIREWPLLACKFVKEMIVESLPTAPYYIALGIVLGLVMKALEK